VQDPGPDAKPTGGGCDPHTLDLAIGRMAFQGATPHRLFVQGGQDEVAVRWRELRRRGRYAERRIETGFEPGLKLPEVVLEAIPGRRRVGIHYGQADGAATQQALNGLHGSEQ